MDDEEILGWSTEKFCQGAIRKLTFRHFLTFDRVTVQAGPNLNVIIGPNGSGKSTIICGICLASGGSPKILGRSDNVGSYISHGELEATVEMKLHDVEAENGVVSFKVVILKPNSAHYYINGRSVTKTVVRNTIAEYNIQVDNPCVFLAQDKVKSFAEQGPLQLLLNTEKAGPKELLQLHNELILIFEKSISVEVMKKEQEEQLKRLRKSIERIRPLAENYKERRRRNACLQVFKEKVAYLETKDAYDRFVNQKTATTAINEQICQIREERARIDLETRDALGQVEKINMVKLNNQIRSIDQNFSQKSISIADCFDNEDVLTARRNLELLKTEYQNWEKDLNHAIKLRDAAFIAWEKAKVEATDNSASREKKKELSELMQKCCKEEQEIKIERRDFLTKKSEICNRLQRSQQSIKEKVIQIARTARNSDIINAYEYYCNHRDEFLQPVYIPFISIELHEDNLIYFNNVFGVKDMAIFIFGCPQDENLLSERKRFRINSTVIDYNDLPDFSARLSPELRQLGFHDYMINMIKAPLPVKAYLNNVYKLSVTLVGNDQVDQDCERIAYNNRNIRLFLTNRSRVQGIGSYYDPNRFTVMRGNLRLNGPLTRINTVPVESQSTKELDNINAKLKALDVRQKDNLEFIQQKKRLEKEIEDLQNEYIARFNAVDSVKRNYEKCERSLGYKQENKPDIERAQAAFEEREKESRMRLPKEFNSLVQTLSDYYKLAKNFIISEANANRQKQKYHNLRVRNQDLEFSLSTGKCQLRESRTKQDVIKAELNKKLKNFREIVHISHVDELKLSDEDKVAMKELQKRFKKYKVPSTIDECNEEIASEEARNAAGKLQGSAEDVQKLEQLEKDEIAMTTELKKSQFIIDNWETEMTALLQKWIGPLRELIKRINTNFSTFFAKIKCTGQVVLSEPENKLKVNDYGLDIMVKFRSYNSMRKLTGQQQSGGERSVSTILYLMALQELCPVPFRCVDEINQGMDPMNERLVFNMMVDLISGEGHLGKTQYFLLTPKLLPGLNYTEKVAVHIIQNTHFMSSGAPLAVYKNDTEVVLA